MVRISIIAVCVCGFGALLFAQTQPDRNNPFEDVPPPAKLAVGPNIIEGVEFRGLHRVPADTMRTVIFSKVGDIYKEATLRLDVAVLRDTGRFEDVRVSTGKGQKGGIVLRFVVTERHPVQ